MLDELENALGAMDTPSGDGINSYVVSKAIRKEGITVALSGMGGDELFAGYPFFKKFLDLQKRSSLFDLSSPLRRLSGNVLEKISSGKYNRISQLLAMDDVSIENAYPIFRQILSPAQISKLTRLASGNEHGIVEQLHTWSDAMDQYPHLSQVSVAEYLGYTQQTLLKDTDQMSMAVALEVREPYFDHELIEFVLAVPDSIKYPTYPKSLLVESVAPLLPDEIVHRRKQGFLFPWKLWLKKELRSFCESKIRNMSQRGFINGDSLMSYWKKFLNDDPAVRWAEVWLFVVLEYWMEKNGIQE
jgi:asparagine synthase (glutamine-hydrolysing)